MRNLSSAFCDTTLHACFILLLVVLARSVTAATLNVGYSHYAPFQLTSSTGKAKGIDIDILDALLADAGFTPNYKKMPWIRQLQVGIKNGELDILLQAKRTKERESFAYFSDQMYLHVKNALFIRKQDVELFNHIHSLEDLTGSRLTIGVARGSIYSEKYAELQKNPLFMQHVQEVNLDEQNIGMLLSGRVDGFLAADLSTTYLLKSHPQGSSVKIHLHLEKDDILSQGSVLMFSKSTMTKDQVNRINLSLNKLLANGTIDKIIAKHNSLPN